MGRKRQRPGFDQADDGEDGETTTKQRQNFDQRRHDRPQPPSTSGSAHVDEESEQSRPQKKRRLHTYERAKLAFERIQEERQQQREQREKDKEAREAALQEYESNKKKKEKVMRQRTKRGQPKLGGQIELLLEKIERTIKKENDAKR